MVLTGVDQLWVADITYIRLREEFLFLAVILDAFSRRVIGWALGRTLEDELTLAALQMALSRRSMQPGLVHHSDRGSQYASGDYTDLLKQNGIGVSMSRKGNPWDNAACESFMKTLKYEEVFRNEYRDLEEARRFASFWRKSITKNGFIPRSAMCRRSSKPISQQIKRGRYTAAFSMSFLRHQEIFPSDGGRQPCGQRPRLIVWMSFRLAIPWRVASPPVPASASPAGPEYAVISSCWSMIFSSNGQLCLNCLSQPGGKAHYASKSPCTTGANSAASALKGCSWRITRYSEKGRLWKVCLAAWYEG